MKNKINKREAKSIETRGKIYESANTLFREHGIDNVSVDLIVKKAGVSKGSFYVHFESKYALIALLISDFVKTLDIDYKSSIESFPENTPASEILMRLVDVIADIISNRIGYDMMKYVYEGLITRSINSDSIIGYNRDLYKTFRNVIYKGIEMEEFKKDIDIDSLITHLILAIRGITFEWCIRHPDFDYKNQVLDHFKVLLDGIKIK